MTQHCASGLAICPSEGQMGTSPQEYFHFLARYRLQEKLVKFNIIAAVDFYYLALAGVDGTILSIGVRSSSDFLKGRKNRDVNSV